jgi:hypothetical protein
MLFNDSHEQGVQEAVANFIAAHPKAQVLVSPFMGYVVLGKSSRLLITSR